MPVRFLINLAYVITGAKAIGVNPVLEGGPGWIDSERYQISAKADHAVNKDAMNGPMLRALLHDNFDLRIRRETKDVPAYELTLVKGGLKLHPFDGSSCVVGDAAQTSLPPGAKPWCGIAKGSRSAELIKTDLPGATMAQFAQILNLSGRVVTDKTGITGKFDFHVEYSPDGANSAADDAAPSMESALARLGLKLERTKTSREFLIIDHIERPTAN